MNRQLAIVLAAVNITETAADDIPTVTGATAMTLFVQQPKNLWRQPANAQIIRSPPLNSQQNSSFHALYTAVAADMSTLDVN